jgi:thioesterase domain-containing protein
MPWVASDFWRSATAESGWGSPPPNGKQPSVEPVVALKKSGALPPLFLAAPIFGSAFPYHYLALHMDPEQPVYGLQSPALDGRSEPHESIPAMARDYIALMQRIQRHGPYYVGGYSFGGWTAFEIARQLQADGESVAFLGILGTGLPPSMGAPAFAKAMEYAWEYLESQLRLARDTGLSEQQRIAQREAEASAGTPLQRVAAANTRAALRYVPRPIEGGLSLFATSDIVSSSLTEHTLGWWLLCTREIDVHVHEGNHLNCFTEPHVRDLARKLDARLKTARERARRG